MLKNHNFRHDFTTYSTDRNTFDQRFKFLHQIRVVRKVCPWDSNDHYSWHLVLGSFCLILECRQIYSRQNCRTRVTSSGILLCNISELQTPTAPSANPLHIWTKTMTCKNPAGRPGCAQPPRYVAGAENPGTRRWSDRCKAQSWHTWIHGCETLNPNNRG